MNSEKRGTIRRIEKGEAYPVSTLKLYRTSDCRFVPAVREELKQEIKNSDLEALRSGKYGTWCASHEHLDEFSFGDFMGCVLYCLERNKVCGIESAPEIPDVLEYWAKKRKDIYPPEVFGRAFYGGSVGPFDGASPAEEYFTMDIFGCNYVYKLGKWEFGHGMILTLGYSPYVPAIAWDDFMEYLRQHVFPKLQRLANVRYCDIVVAAASHIIEHSMSVIIHDSREVFA